MKPPVPAVFIEADYSYRENPFEPMQSACYRKPVCTVNAENLWELAKEESQKTYPNYKSLIDADRDCPRFYEWQPGFTPKEHQEMMAREAIARLQAEQRAADIKREENYQTSQEEFQKWQAGIEQDNAKRENKRDKWRRWELIFICVTMFATAITPFVPSIIDWFKGDKRPAAVDSDTRQEPKKAEPAKNEPKTDTTAKQPEPSPSK
ncbi:MAG: hypothetical protein SGJ20_03865 [Planctomycetota bacterium]|nr:hypothetical protein [Planctomycetota bacterium]